MAGWGGGLLLADDGGHVLSVHTVKVQVHGRPLDRGPRLRERLSGLPSS
jgi:hypothetical protein